MIKYRVEIRNSPNWQAYSAATLGVSIESPNWKGEKLESILDFASKRFDFVRIDVTDTLYRHHFLSASLDHTSALSGARSLGDLWLTQHQDMIDSYLSNKEIIRWDTWYDHPEYCKTLEAFKAAFAENEVFRNLVILDAQNFYKRQGKNASDSMIQHSVNFLIEEIAVLSLQAKDLKSVRLYPGEELECMKFVRQGKIKDVPLWLKGEQFAKIKFKKRKSCKSDDIEMPSAQIA